MVCSILIGCMLSVNAQNPKIRKATAISNIEELFAKAVDGDQSGIRIFMDGTVEEWDMLSQYSIRYKLSEIDLQQAEIIRFEESDEMALLLPCKRNENCVRLTDAGNKQRFYNSLHAFTMPGDKERVLMRIEALLKELQSILPD